jgi:hypothetical protein
MLKSLTFKCPDCEQLFRTIQDKTDPPPRFCPHCAYDSRGGEQMAEGVSMPHIGRPIRGIVDGQYRAMEQGSIDRAQMAMEEFGLDTAAANELKITNQKDGLREGDTSNIAVNNEVSRMIDQAPPGQFGFSGGAAQGLGYSASVPTGPLPNAGGRTAAMLREKHRQFTSTAGHAGATSSSNPALETTNPLYKARVNNW